MSREIKDAIASLNAKCANLERRGISAATVRTKEGRSYLFWLEDRKKRSRVLLAIDQVITARARNERYKDHKALKQAAEWLAKRL